MEAYIILVAKGRSSIDGRSFYFVEKRQLSGHAVLRKIYFIATPDINKLIKYTTFLF